VLRVVDIEPATFAHIVRQARSAAIQNALH
jgi:hypothetical protein